MNSAEVNYGLPQIMTPIAPKTFKFEENFPDIRIKRAFIAI